MKQTDRLILVMSSHIGKGKGISAKALAEKLEVNTRKIRELVSICRDDGIAICALPQSGYFIAENAEELQETTEFLKSRALHSLTIASKLNSIPMADLLGQMHLKT